MMDGSRRLCRGWDYVADNVRLGEEEEEAFRREIDDDDDDDDDLGRMATYYDRTVVGEDAVGTLIRAYRATL